MHSPSGDSTDGQISPAHEGGTSSSPYADDAPGGRVTADSGHRPVADADPAHPDGAPSPARRGEGEGLLAVDRARLARAVHLDAQQVGNGAWLVTGGERSHVVNGDASD